MGRIAAAIQREGGATIGAVRLLPVRGGGVKARPVHGRSDRQGAFPTEGRVTRAICARRCITGGDRPAHDGADQTGRPCLWRTAGPFGGFWNRRWLLARSASKGSTYPACRCGSKATASPLTLCAFKGRFSWRKQSLAPSCGRERSCRRKVKERLRRATNALDAAGFPYAVVGGNAVADWVARIDEGAIRLTRNVDVLVPTPDL